jgi:hypothetical protein
MSNPNLARSRTRPRPPRRWLQFRLRTALAVVTLACVLLGLLTKPLMDWRRERAAIEALQKAAEDGYVQTNTVRYPGFGLFRHVLGPSIYRRADRVGIDGRAFGNDDLRHLEDLRHVQVLDLRMTAVTDAGLVHLKGLAKLDRLNLSGTQITDAGLAHLRNLPEITVLDLHRTQVTDAGLEHLRGMTELESLDVFGTGVTYDGLTRLDRVLPRGSFAEERAIVEIQAVGGQVVTVPKTLEEEQRLTRYSAARYLYLDGDTMSGDAMPHVRYLRSLREANFRALRPGDRDLAPLAELPKLEVLEVWLTEIDEQDLVNLGRIESLRKLSFHVNGMTDAGLEHLAHLERLEKLVFDQTGVTEADVDPLRKALPDCRIGVQRTF